MRTSEFLTLPLMEASLKSGKGQGLAPALLVAITPESSYRWTRLSRTRQLHAGDATTRRAKAAAIFMRGSCICGARHITDFRQGTL